MKPDAEISSNPFSELPPSAKKIYTILSAVENRSSGLTTKEVLVRVNYASRTVRYALKRLVALQLIRKLPYLQDMRQSKYLVNGQ